MRVAVVTFPGSNCDTDCLHAVSGVLGEEAVAVWHKEAELPAVDAVILPGGFSYGDYLRSGAIASTSPVMDAVRRFAANGGPVLGICNGFQVLLESGLLMGGMRRNRSLRFTCKRVHLRVESTVSAFTSSYEQGQVVSMPVAHGEGNYFADPQTLMRLNAEGLVAFRYCDANGALDPDSNPNGSLENIAGIFNKQRNVLGLMPHPERCVEAEVGGLDGLGVFQSLLEAVRIGGSHGA